MPPIPRNMTEKIIAAACMYYQCTEDTLRTTSFQQQKKIVIYLLRENACISFSQIGTRLQYADHSGPNKIFAEISLQKNIYAHIRHDINNITEIAATLL